MAMEPEDEGFQSSLKLVEIARLAEDTSGRFLYGPLQAAVPRHLSCDLTEPYTILYTISISFYFTVHACTISQMV